MASKETNSRENSPETSPEDTASVFQLVSPGMPADPRIMTQNDRDQLVQALRTRRVNTITELRRVEKVFADMNTPEVSEPMTSAWKYYVESYQMLNELRGLTQRYPFSSECLDEAKRLVVNDPESARSWNMCWLILIKILRENLITKHARDLANKRSTWGTVTPSAAQIEQLIAACSEEWTRALRQMLRHWDKPPTTTGQ